MDTCDVVIVGGGPAGSSCAWKLGKAGCDVVVVDKSRFPRDKLCGGWITPPVIDRLELDVAEYRRGRTFQPITGFRVGVIGDGAPVETSYGHPVSFGIRRCEFDDYLLRRSGARLRLGEPVASAASVRRDGRHWIVNESVRAPMLVGAGGHFCPVASMLNRQADRTSLVAAQEVEVVMDARGCAVAGELPELYFCADFRGYGWCFRKGEYVNVGLGRLDPRALPGAIHEFIGFLTDRERIPKATSWSWRGHAYLIARTSYTNTVGDAVVLAGDAAGLAYSRSGEGILPAIESGLMAAATILRANGTDRSDLRSYSSELSRRFGERPAGHDRPVVPQLRTALARWLLRMPWFVRHVVVERCFLHA